MQNQLSNQQVGEFLRKQTLIKGITDEELSYLVDMAEFSVAQPNEVIFPEGDHSSELYFIYKGEVSITKIDRKNGNEYTLNILKERDFFGDLAFLDGEPRSSTVKANCETFLLKISKESSYAQSAEMVSIYNKIMKNIAKINLFRIRETNQFYIDQIGNEVRGLKQALISGKLCIVGLLLFWACQMIAGKIQDPLLQPLLLMTVVPLSLIVIINQSIGSLSHYGLTTQDWKKNIKPGIGLSLILIIIVAALILIGRLMHLIYPNIGAFQLTPLKLSPTLFLFPFYAYVMEFILRGVIQTSLKDFLQDESPKKAILYTALIIACLNLPIGIGWAFCAFVLNCFLGYLYHDYPQLVGNACLHTTIGLILVLLNWIPPSWLFRI